MNLMPVLLVVIESGALYSATLITLLATYLAGSWAQYLLIDALTPIIVCTPPYNACLSANILLGYRFQLCYSTFGTGTFPFKPNRSQPTITRC